MTEPILSWEQGCRGWGLSRACPQLQAQAPGSLPIGQTQRMFMLFLLLLSDWKS